MKFSESSIEAIDYDYDKEGLREKVFYGALWLYSCFLCLFVEMLVVEGCGAVKNNVVTISKSSPEFANASD